MSCPILPPFFREKMLNQNYSVSWMSYQRFTKELLEQSAIWKIQLTFMRLLLTFLSPGKSTCNLDQDFEPWVLLCSYQTVALGHCGIATLFGKCGTMIPKGYQGRKKGNKTYNKTYVNISTHVYISLQCKSKFNWLLQGAKKVSFTACHLGKL